MNRPTCFAGVALAAMLAGCSSSLEDDPDDAWVDVDVTQFASDGESERVSIPAQELAAAVAVRATTDAGVCFQLSSVVDGAGRTGQDGRSPGPFCRDCELRSSVAVGAGVFVFPVEAGGLAPDTGLSLRFARINCVTLTSLNTPEDRPTLQVAVQPIDEVPDRSTIELRFHIATSSILFADAQRQEQLLAALAQQLAPAGIVPRLASALELDELPTELRFHTGDPAALAAVIATVPPRDETTIDVVFGGCLLHDDPIFGPPRPLHGFTPRIPGGAGPADGVFMPGLDCFAAGAGPVDVPVDVQARVLAHELGHYLGLYHAVEQDGLTDTLADTGPDNIMHFNPQLATSAGFSPSQGRMMRMHPAAR
jgi:hypothetical protein